jgi:N-acetylneuraminate synthase
MPTIQINHRTIGTGHPAYIIAEVSANHNQDFEQAKRIIEAAKEAGADAVKLQTYTPDTLTIDCNNAHFQIKGTLWEGRNLYQLYQEAYTPWEWHPKLQQIALDLDLDFFSTPFDATAVAFLETLKVPAYKVASFENGDIPLLKEIAKTGKPVIMSTGLATLGEIDEAVQTLKTAGTNQLILLKCTSAYPAPPEEANLRTIKHLSETFGVPAGLSDHTLGISVPVAAVVLGACVIEKHLTFSRNMPGPDSAFSLEPDEFKAMVEAIRTAEKAMGTVTYAIGPKQAESRAFRRSLFAVETIPQGAVFTRQNVRSIRPGYGLHPRHLEKILGQCATTTIHRGTPLDWSHVGPVS